MAGGTFAISGRVMFEWGFCNRLLQVVMAFVAKLSIRFDEQFLDVRLVRFVARNAFPVLDRLMFHFASQQLLLRIVVALKAKFPVRFNQQPPKIR